MQTSIPAILMRGGTSRGLYFNKDDLPKDRSRWDEIFLRALGSPDARQIDGVGGTTSVTSKVCIVSPSNREHVDVDYLFAQVSVEEAKVDYGPTCGNMLAGIGPYAVETGMVEAKNGETLVRIYQVNTDGLVEACVPTPNGQVECEGDVTIDGVPGSGAPIILNFSQVVGSHTGKLFPTGRKSEVISGIKLTLIDASMPVVIIRAENLGKTGYETISELNSDLNLLSQIENIRCEAGKRMGLGDVSEKVVPKIILASTAREDGNISSRYFVPNKVHETHAITGGIALAFASHEAGTVVHEIAKPLPEGKRSIFSIEHPKGKLELILTMENVSKNIFIRAVGITRTARMIMRGSILVPERLTNETLNA